MDEDGEFQDWEMLQSTETSLVSAPDLDEKLGGFEGIDGGSEGSIKSDYFALGSEGQYGKKVAEEDQEEESLGSDDPSGFDPLSKPWRNDGKLTVFDGKRELGYGDDAKRGVGFEETGIESKNSGELVLDSGGEEFFMWKFEGVAGEDALGSGDKSETREGSESGGILEVGGGDCSDSVGFVEGVVEFPSGVENGAGAEVKSGEGEKRVVWWKLPLELLKFCVFRVSPVWSVSIAAAVVGFVILRRTLYKMRRKSRSIAPKVSVDAKKVSQIMIRVAHLNEAFLVVKRVPIIRSSLPGTRGVTPWPMMGLRCNGP